jgi:SAM-dependent methyltransferase
MPELEDAYADAADPDYLREEAGLRATFRRTVRMIGAHVAPGRLLDAGCGPGLMLEEALATGWTAEGLEPSGWACEVARQRGLAVTRGTLDSVPMAEETYDAIAVCDVIEHLVDPAGFVAKARRATRTGGVIFVCTPNVESIAARVLRRWWWSVLPGHVCYFSPATLARLLETGGFTILRTGSHPKTFSLDYYAGRLSGYASPLGRIARWAARPIGGTQRLVTPDFHDRFFMLAGRR